MAFLRIEDYSQIITQENLSVIQGEDAFRRDAELSAQEEISSYLRHRYSTELIYIDIQTFSLSATYSIGDLVEYNETTYDATATYTTDNRVSYSGSIYKSIAGNTPEAWDSSKWTLISDNNILYNVTQSATGEYPDASISIYSTQDYLSNIDKITGWDGANIILYFKKTSSSVISIYASSTDRTNDTNSIGSIPYDAEGLNVPKNVELNTVSTLSGWVTIKNYIPALEEFEVSLSNAFTLGDNRNAKIKSITLDLALFELHKRINPRNIPDLRVTAKEEAIAWLTRIVKSNSNVQVNLPLKPVETTDMEIEYGFDDQVY